MAAHCFIPNVKDIETHIEKNISYKRTVSTRKPNGGARLDPLIASRRNFVLATQSEYGPNETLGLQSSKNNFSFQNTLANNTIDDAMNPVIGDQSPVATLQDDSSLQKLMQKSPRYQSAKRSLPFNVDNLQKHSVRTKLSELEYGGKVAAFIKSGMLSPRPLKMELPASQMRGASDLGEGL